MVRVRTSILAPPEHLPSLGFLGSVGTFTEEALVTQKDLALMPSRPYSSMLEVLEAVETGIIDLGFVPIENMIEGAVTSSIDSLAFGTGLMIQREVTMDVRLKLMALRASGFPTSDMYARIPSPMPSVAGSLLGA